MTFCMQGWLDKCYRPGDRAPGAAFCEDLHYKSTIVTKDTGVSRDTHIIHVDNNSGKVRTSQDTGSWR